MERLSAITLPHQASGTLEHASRQARDALIVALRLTLTRERQITSSAARKPPFRFRPAPAVRLSATLGHREAPIWHRRADIRSPAPGLQFASHLLEGPRQQSHQRIPYLIRRLTNAGCDPSSTSTIRWFTPGVSGPNVTKLTKQKDPRFDWWGQFTECERCEHSRPAPFLRLQT
jgi:hypothetical protein